MRPRRRLTRKGYKIRKTRRINQVKKRVADLNIGDNDKAKVIELLTNGNLSSKKGLERSKRLETLLLDEGNAKKLSRFKEFEGLKEVEMKSLSKNDIIKSIGRQDYEWYNKNLELINEYNAEYKNMKAKYGAGFANKKSSNYNKAARDELFRSGVAKDMDESLAEYRQKMLKKNSPF